MRLVAATGNKKKLWEIQRIMEHIGVQVLTPDMLGVVSDAIECGETFRANAAIKAWDIYRKTGLPSIADDSGLCIDALDGRPGVYSSRYGGEDTEYAVKFRMLFDKLRDVPQEERTARFTSAICCVLDEDTVIEVEESCEGYIGHEASGEGGFGYDPIFYMGERSFADFSPEEKDAVSHRGKALRAFVKKMEDYLKYKGEI